MPILKIKIQEKKRGEQENRIKGRHKDIASLHMHNVIIIIKVISTLKRQQSIGQMPLKIQMGIRS